MNRSFNHPRCYRDKNERLSVIVPDKKSGFLLMNMIYLDYSYEGGGADAEVKWANHV
jgi:hypothetical protein